MKFTPVGDSWNALDVAASSFAVVLSCNGWCGAAVFRNDNWEIVARQTLGILVNVTCSVVCAMPGCP